MLQGQYKKVDMRRKCQDISSHSEVFIWVCGLLQKSAKLMVLIGMKKESSAQGWAAVPLPSPRSPAYPAFL